MNNNKIYNINEWSNVARQINDDNNLLERSSIFFITGTMQLL